MNLFRQLPYRTFVVLVMLTSWLFMLATSACVMPIVMQAAAQQTPTVMASDCDDATHHAALHSVKAEPQNPDCLLKPCPDAQQNPALADKIAKLDIPTFALWLVALIAVSYPSLNFRILPRWQNNDFANTVPIRYRFCVLLN